MLLTGFLGSGKTTVLQRVLDHNAEDTAVLVNELGEVGLDHNLLLSANDTTLILENGCICCKIDDLTTCLHDLFWNRLHRRIPRFKRVVVETTGLADPAPVVENLLSDNLVVERYCLERTVCTVDAVLGEKQLAMHPEAVKQASLADVILLTKVDIADSSSIDRLQQALTMLNPTAELHRVALGEVSPEVLLAYSSAEDAQNERRASNSSAAHRLWDDRIALSTTAQRRGPFKELVHHGRVSTVTIHLESPWRKEDLERALKTTVSRHGDRLLRVKGLVDVEGEARPVVVQIVGQMLFPWHVLPEWPSQQKRSYLVFIAQGISPGELCSDFALLPKASDSTIATSTSEEP